MKKPRFTIGTANPISSTIPNKDVWLDFGFNFDGFALPKGIVTWITLIARTSSPKGDVFVDTGIRLRNTRDLSLAYKLVERKMLGSLSRKHYSFALDSGRKSESDLGVMRILPAYEPSFTFNGESRAQMRYVRVYDSNLPSSFEVLRRRFDVSKQAGFVHLVQEARLLDDSTDVE